MRDARINQLAHNLVNYSINLQPGEKVLIESSGFELPLTIALIEEAYLAGGLPFVNLDNEEINQAYLTQATEDQIKLMAEIDSARMEKMDAYIGMRAKFNQYTLSSVPTEKMNMYNKLYSQPVHHNLRVAKTKWVILRYPNHSMAQLAHMDTRSFENFYFNVCNLDYSKMDRAMDPLAELLAKSDQVELKGPGLDLRFSIAGIGSKKCSGHFNIPDGEVYTAPVKDSIEGEIIYNTPSTSQGTTFNNVHFKFKQGKIIGAEACPNTAKLQEILDTDPGARYIGEWALGVNPYITRPINDILFDEKIMGSFHLTPGSCYEEVSNGNESAIHWDLVHNQTAAYGGGEIWLDGKLIRKNGLFVLPELLNLNPENLI